MNVLLALLGALLLLVAAVDSAWTALWIATRPSPLSNAVASTIWSVMGLIVPEERRALRSTAGPLSLGAILVVWLLLIWAGWTLILSADPQSLVPTRTGLPADLSGRIYFVAYSMFTMGNGDFYPAGDGWELVTSLIAGSGMVLVTLAVSYLLSVLPAVVQSRTLASQIQGLGGSGADLVVSWWNGESFPGLDAQLQSFTASLTQSAQQHYAYPILHVYRGPEYGSARAPAIAILDEALTLLHFGVAGRHDLAPGVIAGARAAVADYLESLRAVGISAAEDVPPLPDLKHLRAHGIPTVDDETFAEHIDHLDERRRLLLGLVQHDGMPWPEGKDERHTEVRAAEAQPGAQ